jgi:hypothetical protein
MKRTELIRRLNAVESTRDTIRKARDLITKISSINADERHHTDDQLKVLLDLCAKIEDDLNSKLDAQSATPAWLDPIITAVEIEHIKQRIRGIIILLEAPPPKPQTTNVPDDSNDSSATQEESAPTESPAQKENEKHDEL